MAKEWKFKGVKWYGDRKQIVCLDPIFLDTETSNNHAADPKDLVTWITTIQVLWVDQKEPHIFRTPEEFINYLLGIYKKYNLEPTDDRDKKIVIYVHNLSYDISYLMPYIRYYLPHNEVCMEIIPDKNEVLVFRWGAFEFRCSLMLSGMSLEKWSKEMQVEHPKLVGFYDYQKIIYQDDELTEKELAYDENDVIAMKECFYKQMSYHKDNLITTPLTATGYPRRDLRRACKADSNYRKQYFINNKLDDSVYDACLKSYAGGYTHNNRYYKDLEIKVGDNVTFRGKKIKVERIRHRDFKSHYPSQMTCNKFPMGKFISVYDANDNEDITIEEILAMSPEYSTLSIIEVQRAELKDQNISMPFMQFSKCYHPTFTTLRRDNGRILRAWYDQGEYEAWFNEIVKKGYLTDSEMKKLQNNTQSFTLYIDNYTLSILNEQYYLDYKVIKVWRSKNEKLPKCIVDVIDKYFRMKAELKLKVKECEKLYGKDDPRTMEAEFEYAQSKKAVNGLYGCFAMKCLRDSYMFDDDLECTMMTNWEVFEDIQEGLDGYYSKKQNFLHYPVGVWITAMARYELYEYIKVIGYENILYCDTDSAFYISTPEIENAIEALNDEKKAKAHYVTLANGDREYYDAFVPEDDCLAFKGLHSKCYGVVYYDKKKQQDTLSITVAGVPRRTIIGMDGNEPVYKSREEELAGKETNPYKALDNLADGFKFKTNTGLTGMYIGAMGAGSERVPTVVMVDGHKIHTAGGCVLRPVDTKEIHDTKD